MRVLVAEDEAILSRTLAHGLRRSGMAVDTAGDGRTALDLTRVNRYDVLVLDRDLPGLHGDDVCREVVGAGGGTRVLMLTAAADVRSRVQGLRLGADDYLPKPFDFDELVARVQALGRRPARLVPPVLSHGDLRLDPGGREVTRAGRLIPLSPKEFAVLEGLLRRAGTVVSAEELLEQVWDEHADPFTSAVRVTMSKLRAKLGEPDPILTVPGAGYRVG